MSQSIARTMSRPWHRLSLIGSLVLGLGACQTPPTTTQVEPVAEPAAMTVPAQSTTPAPVPVAPRVADDVQSTNDAPRPTLPAPTSVAAPPAPRHTPLKPGDQLRRLTVNAARRTYLLHVPANYDPAVAHPLLIVLHGRGGSSAGARGWGFSQRAGQKGWLIAYPEALPPTRSWPTRLGNTESATNDVAYLEALVGDIRLLAHMDDARLFAVGYSTGGSFAAHLAGELKAPAIAAIAVVGANIATRTREGALATVTLPTRPVSALFLQGRLDRAAPTRGGPSVLLDGANALGVLDGAQLWARTAACAETPHPIRSGAVELERFEPCGDAALVEVETWAGGHEWPRTLPIEGRRPVATVDHIIEFLETSRSALGSH